jgi:dTDP-glucose 4,6-dehydratase
LRTLVTGGAGFIGSNFVRHLLQSRPDAAIVNLDKLTYAGNLENLEGLEATSRYEFIRGDVADADFIRSVFERPFDAVVHFAAETHVDRSIAGGREFIQTNVLGTYTLLDAARKARVPRFIHVSTDEVYGSLEPGANANEKCPLAPNSPYAASKASSDLVARSFWSTYRFPVITTRCSNNYGPCQFPEKLIPLMITRALRDQKLPVYGDGLNERDWIFVQDHCRAIESLLVSGSPGEVYNIGFGQPITNLEIVRALLRSLKKPDSLVEYVADRPGHDRRYALNTRKIQAETNWKPTVGLEEGLARTVQWYVSHAGWVERTTSGEYRSYYEKFYERRNATLAEI